MESRDFVEAQRVIVHSSDAGDYIRGSTGGRDCVGHSRDGSDCV